MQKIEQVKWPLEGMDQCCQCHVKYKIYELYWLAAERGRLFSSDILIILLDPRKFSLTWLPLAPLPRDIAHCHYPFPLHLTPLAFRVLYTEPGNVPAQAFTAQ